MAWHHIIPHHEWKRRINYNATRWNSDFNSTDNLVNLTTYQHAQAHQLNFEQFGYFEDFLAWKMILGQIGKEEAQILIAQNTGKNNKGKKRTLEYKIQQSIKLKKYWNSQAGLQQKELQRIKMLGTKLSGESRKKISESKIGKPRNQATKEKISKTRTGIIVGPMSQNAKDSHRIANSKNWEVISPNGKIIYITNLREFCKTHGLSQSNMSSVASGKLNHYKKWKCKRIT